MRRSISSRKRLSLPPFIVPSNSHSTVCRSNGRPLPFVEAAGELAQSRADVYERRRLRRLRREGEGERQQLHRAGQYSNEEKDKDV